MRYIDERQAEEQYDDYLDEVLGTGELTDRYGAARILKAVDPIAYRVGFNDYLDAHDLTTDETEADEADDEDGNADDAAQAE